MPSITKLRRQPVFFYTDNQVAPVGQGSAVRIYTNLRAYIDLGFNVEVIRFEKIDNTKKQLFIYPVPGISEVQVEYRSKHSTFRQKLAYILGYPRTIALDVMFPIKPFVVEQVKKRQKAFPDAIHHFEYDQVASAAVNFSKINSIWSNHDISSIRLPMLLDMRKELVDINVYSPYRIMRTIRVNDSENWIANHQRLILCIAEHEYNVFRGDRNYQNAELFPMSWPDEEMINRRRKWVSNGVLRLLHLGSIDGFVGYDSLRFILEQVFPYIPSEALNSIELLVVGRSNDNGYSKKIRKLAEHYPQIKFLGYVDDIKKIYSEVDVQIVGGSRATGVRTRIIESMVYGVPVLSTIEMAKGILGLSHGYNILLAHNGQNFAVEIRKVLSNPDVLSKLSLFSRKTYDKYYSRNVSKDKLANYLEKYMKI